MCAGDINKDILFLCFFVFSCSVFFYNINRRREFFLLNSEAFSLTSEFKVDQTIFIRQEYQTPLCNAKENEKDIIKPWRRACERSFFPSIH